MRFSVVLVNKGNELANHDRDDLMVMRSFVMLYLLMSIEHPSDDITKICFKNFHFFDHMERKSTIK